MATQKQVFTEITESIDRCNHTLPGLIQFLKNGFKKLENASGSDDMDSGWKELATSLTYRKIGKRVNVASHVSELTTNSWNTLGTLPSGYRPATTQYFAAIDGNNAICTVTISNAGVISAKPSTSVSCYGQFEFLID